MKVIGNKQLIKDLNRSIVINAIRNDGPISRTDISSKTTIGLSTITKIVEQLKAENLVSETGEANSTGGRRAILLEFNEHFGYTVAVKVMEDHINLAVTTLNATILHNHTVVFPKNAVAEEVLPLLQEAIEHIIVQNKYQKENLLGIGIAISGLVDGNNGELIWSPLLQWKNVNIKDTLFQHYQVPIYIDNDVNAYTYAELRLGYGKTHHNFICVSVGDGIGSGIVINGKLYYGQFGGAGEFGHNIIVADGYPCHCGQKGCLEMYASAKYLHKEGTKLLKDPTFNDSVLQDQPIEFTSVYQAAKQGDSLSIHLLEKLGNYLGVGLTNMINSFNPATIILIGEGMEAKDFFLPHAIHKADQNFFNKANYNTVFQVSELGDDAWLQGAALITIDHLFEPPVYTASQVNQT